MPKKSRTASGAGKREITESLRARRKKSTDREKCRGSVRSQKDGDKKKEEEGRKKGGIRARKMLLVAHTEVGN